MVNIPPIKMVIWAMVYDCFTKKHLLSDTSKMHGFDPEHDIGQC
jgi:hypothetical protein